MVDLLTIVVALVTIPTTTIQKVQESTLSVTSAECNVPVPEYIVILPPKEEDGLLFRGDKMEVLILRTGIG